MPNLGDIKVWYIPQIPMEAFEVEVPDLKTAVMLLDLLGRFSYFEYVNRVKPDYSDAGGIARYEENGEGGYDWYDVDEYELEEV